MNYLLIGRPNVGKSSIYNILTRSNSNIIHKESGTTRDWHKGKIFSATDHYIFDTNQSVGIFVLVYNSNTVNQIR